MTDDTGPSGDDFVSHLCAYRPQLRMLLGLCAFFFLLSLGSLAVVERGTATYVVTMLNVVALSGFSALFGGILLLCRRR